MSFIRKIPSFIINRIAKSKILQWIAGNRFVQKVLEKNVFILQYWMGIGSGSGVSTSGEKRIFNIIEKICTPPLCIFDIGANKGQFLDLALEFLSTDDFSVHCFEPGVETFKILSKREEDTCVKLNNLGIGKKKDLMTLYYDKPGSGLASLTKRRLDHLGKEFNKSEIVQIDTIDNYCKENNIERINLLKIDIEGFELDAFAGAKAMFSNKSVDLVTFEFGGCNIDTRTFFQDFWYFFSDIGMKVFRITPSGYFFKIKSYKEIDEQFRTTNFIAIKNDYLHLI